jgi:hypothetical protein
MEDPSLLALCFFISLIGSSCICLYLLCKNEVAHENEVEV